MASPGRKKYHLKMTAMSQVLHSMVHHQVTKLTSKMKLVILMMRAMELLEDVAEGDEDDIEVDVVEGNPG